MCTYVYHLLTLCRQDAPGLIFSQASKMLKIVFGLKVVWCKGWEKNLFNSFSFFYFFFFCSGGYSGEKCLFLWIEMAWAIPTGHLCETHLVVGYVFGMMLLPCLWTWTQATAGVWQYTLFMSFHITWPAFLPPQYAFRQDWPCCLELTAKSKGLPCWGLLKFS